MSNIIETFNLTKRFSKLRDYLTLFRFKYQEDLTAVDSVNLQIRKGELFGLLGANGAGKTTLIKMLCTLILPSEGRAVIDGYDVVADSAAVRHIVGLVNAEDRSFFWRLSGRQNLEFFAALYGLPRLEARQRISELLSLIGLSDHADRRFMAYSSGMRQKLAIARGLLSMPPIIFMDEPTRSLDPVGAHDLRTFIRETLVDKLGRTVILVTHRLEEAEAICDRVAIMKDGQIISCGPVAEIKQRIKVRQKYYLQVQHISSATLTGLNDINGVVQFEWTNGHDPGFNLELVLADEKNSLPLVLRYLVSSGCDIQYCQAEELSLEEVFVHLIRKDKDKDEFELQSAGFHSP